MPTNNDNSDEKPSKNNVPEQLLIPVPEWNNYYSWPSESSLWHLIFEAETNGYGGPNQLDSKHGSLRYNPLVYPAAQSAAFH